MLKLSERHVVIGGLFFFAFWLYVALPFLYTVPRYSSDHGHARNACSAEEEKNRTFWERTDCDPTAYFTLWLVAFTGVLALSTIGLWTVTRKGVRTQTADTRILQRAYVAVMPRGLRLRIDGSSLMAHVAIHNAGNLPASNLSSSVNIRWDNNDQESQFPVEPRVGHIIITPRAETTRGSDGSIEVQELLSACRAEQIPENYDQEPVYVYVWGTISYNDGFTDGRVTEFCHRYNWAMRDGNYSVSAEHARLHEFGNSFT